MKRSILYFYPPKEYAKTWLRMYLTVFTFYMCMTNQNKVFNMSVEISLFERYENLPPPVEVH